jgi:ribosome-associated protein
MADMSSKRDAAIACARLLSEHKGEDTVVLDISAQSSFADYFIITTARSAAHVTGLFRDLAGFFRERDLIPRNRHKGREEKGWLLLDCGDLVIHVMEREQREFYDLERLWFKAERVPYWSKSS